MRKLKPREGESLAGSQSQLATQPTRPICSVSRKREQNDGGKRSSRKITLPGRLASSSQGTDRRKARVLGEEAPPTPVCTHTHMIPGALSLESRLVLCVCVCVAEA